MKRFLIFAVALVLLGGVTVTAMQQQKGKDKLQIVPWPNQISMGSGSLSLKEGVRVQGATGFLSNYVTRMLRGEALVELDPQARITVSFGIDPALSANLGEEGYTLTVDRDGIRIAAAADAGLFYGVQTLRQLIEPDGTIPYVTIEDKPAFVWRAYLLDEGRYFKGMEVVKGMLDEMARLKMNVLHWHLTEDAGWRIEIKKYPLLTEIGAWRDSSEIGTWRSGQYDGKPHGGFYTQDEIREIVRYAADRHITIMPEIEMPGHASAAIAAYPWLGTTGEQIRVPINFAHNPWIYNVADPRVYEFLQDVILEVIELFPSKVIHIGGDEVPYGHWKDDPQVQALMEREGMENLSDVQVYFTNNMSNFIDGLGRRMMGWNEILGKNIHEWSDEENASGATTLAQSAVIHFWKGDLANMKEALSQGYDVVNSNHSDTYIDYSYKSLPISRSYAFNPVPAGATEEEAARVLGLGCQMWCEWAPTVADIHRMSFPRIAAYAETGWTRAENKDYNRFLRELPRLRGEWKSRGIVAGGEEDQ